MLVQSEISFIRDNYEDGFGFNCLKAAYHFDIKGRMDYSNKSGVTIQAEGEIHNIREFLHWIHGNALLIRDIQYINIQTDTGRFKEFDLYRHES
ncbi:MAG: acylphosphatase [Bacteroidales bacterium]|nr:acylphosphatase [Bacteroidales bacterium]